MSKIIKKVKLFQNDMEEKLELEIERDINGKTCKFYFTDYDQLGNKRKRLTKTISLDYLCGATF